MSEVRWKVSDDRKWCEVYNEDDALIALFTDGDMADRYVRWLKGGI